MSKKPPLSWEDKLRRVDALIAEHCFGWKWTQVTKTKRTFNAPPPVYHAGVKTIRNEWHFIGFIEKPNLPLYTVDRAAAFMVLEWTLKHFSSPECAARLELFFKPEAEPGSYYCGLRHFLGVNNCSFASTLPIAICLYALKCQKIECLLLET